MKYLFLSVDAKRFITHSPDENGADFLQFNADIRKKKLNSWATCADTLQRLSEQYLSNRRPLSPLKQIFMASDTFQRKDFEEEQNAQNHVTSQTPPPLLHRPAKRFLEQSHVNGIPLDPKRPRQENNCNVVEENHSKSVSKEGTKFRDEMFEKTCSLGGSLKQLRPPPPLLKQTAIDKSGRQPRKYSPQDHYTFTKEGYEGFSKSTSPLKNTTRITRLRGYDSDKKDTVEPAPRQIEGDCKSSCGGFAFDHTAMPKIVAVHSISKNGEDHDEWEKNKAFISKVKSAQNRSDATAEGAQKISQMTRLQSKSAALGKIPETLLQDPRGSNEKNLCTVADERNFGSQVSFERYVLYYLLSKFQGNVEQVKCVLEQNLLQEWLSFRQGNADPRVQTTKGVNFYELRKLYEFWCQLQRNSKANQVQGTTKQTIWNAHNSETNRAKTRGDSNPLQNQPSGFPNSQSLPNTQSCQTAAYPRPNRRNCSPKVVSDQSQNVPETPAHSSRTPSNFQEGVYNNATEGPYGSSNGIPVHIQEKICVLSQKSSNRTFGHDFLPAQNTNNYLAEPPTQLRFPKSTPANHLSDFNGNQHTLSPERSQGNNVIDHVPRDERISRDEGQAEAFRSAQEHVVRNHYEASERMHSQSKIVVQEQERTDGTNISSVTLMHISQTKLKPTQAGNLTLSPTHNIRAKSSGESGQSQHVLKHANHLESSSKNVVSGQETKANYLWRFKGGKLISDSIPSINDKEPTSEVGSRNVTSVQCKSPDEKLTWQSKSGSHTSGQQSYHKFTASTPSLPSDRSCNIQSSKTCNQTLAQQHKKVCGAAASGKPCFCVLEPKSGVQSVQNKSDPIQCLQQLLSRTDKSSPNAAPSLSIQRQNSDFKVKDCRRISATPTTLQTRQQYHAGLNTTRNVQDTHQCQTGLQAQVSLHYASLSNSHSAGAQQTPDCPQEQGSQSSLSHRNLPNDQFNQQANVDPNILNNEQDTQQSYTGVTNSSNSLAIKQSYASHRICPKTVASDQFSPSSNVLGGARNHHQSFASHKFNSNTQTSQESNTQHIPSNWQAGQQSSTNVNISSCAQEYYKPNSIHKNYTNGQTSQSCRLAGVNVQGKQSYNSFSISSSSQGNQLTSPSLNYSSNSQLKHQSSTRNKLSSNTQGNQQCHVDFSSSSTAHESQETSISPYNTCNTIPSQQSSVSLCIASHVGANQSSKASLNVSQNAEHNQQTVSLKKLLSAQPNQRYNECLRILTSAQENDESNSSCHVGRNAQASSPSNAANQSNKEFKANLDISCKSLPGRQSSPSFHMSPNTKQANQQSVASLKALLAAQPNQQANESFQVSRNLKGSQHPNSSFKVPCNSKEANQQSGVNLKTMFAAQPNQQPNSSFNVPRNAQAIQKYDTIPKTLSVEKTSPNSNASLHISQSSAKTMTKIAPKVNTTPTSSPKPTLSTNPSHQATKWKKTQNAVITKSDKVKEKQCSFPGSLAPRKQYTSLQQLAKKVVETRKRYEKENIPWKKKILKSLEGVLMKRLRKIERETGEEAELGSEENSATEGITAVENNKK